jgi:hypothetical protein
MSIKKTNKLFHDKYVYKVCVVTPVAFHFRGNDLERTKLILQLDEIDLSKDGRVFVKIGGNYSRTHAAIDDVRGGLEILNVLESDLNHKLRVEGRFLSIYSNNESLIDQISNIPGLHIRDIWKPVNDKAKEFLLTGPRAIIRKNYSHKYKVSIRGLKSEAENFKSWAAKLPKVKIISWNSYKWDSYFYVADEKTLSMCRLFLGSNVKKVEELVTETEI